MAEGIVVVGYQGIGKSTLSDSKSNCIDLESGNFWIDGDRWTNWFIPYCNIAVDIASQGRIVFVSSHEVVRRQLRYGQYPKCVHIMCCVPSTNLREAWIYKLHERFNTSLLSKDYRAWKNAVMRFEENIKEIMDSGFPCCELTSMDYNLSGALQFFITEQGWNVSI